MLEIKCSLRRRRKDMRKEVINLRFRSLSKVVIINLLRRGRSHGALTFNHKIKLMLQQISPQLPLKRSRRSLTTQRKQSSMLSRKVWPYKIHTCAFSIPRSVFLYRASSICSSGTMPRTLSKSSIQVNKLLILQSHLGKNRLGRMRVLMIISQWSKCEPSKPSSQSIARSSSKLQRSKRIGW